MLSEYQANSMTVSAMGLAGIPIPTRLWVLEGLIPSRTITSLYGDGGTGKSLLSIQLAICLATGSPFLGMPVKKHRVFAVYCEDDHDELHRRIDSVLHGVKKDYDDLAFFEYESWVGSDTVLMDFKHGKGALSSRFEQLEQKISLLRPDVLILDTAADLFGGNENSRTEVRQFIAGCLGRLTKNYNLTIILLAHPSVAGLRDGTGTGGNTAWNNSVRSRLYLERAGKDDDAPADNDLRILSSKKANYGSIGHEIKMWYRNGYFLPDIQQTRVVMDKGEIAEEKFLTLLDVFDAQGRPSSGSKNATNYAPKIFAKSPDADGIKQKDFERAMESLFSRGAIKMMEYGKPSKKSKKLVRVKEPVESHSMPFDYGNSCEAEDGSLGGG